jgi:tetratricopeptide (TPR) repeat protein
MYFFLILLGIAPGALANNVIVYLPAFLEPFLGFAANYYYIFVSFHLLGYVLLQYHLEIGYEVRYEDFRAPDVENRGVSEQDQAATWSEERHADSLIQNGRYDEALEFLEQRFRAATRPATELCRKYFKLLQMKGMDKETIQVGRHLIPGLLERGERQEARRVFEQCLESDSSFLPDAESLFQIAEIHDEAGEHKRALKLYQRLYQNHPRHGRAVEAIFRMGYILNERLFAPDKARQVLERVIASYPEDPLRNRIENYLRHSVP